MKICCVFNYNPLYRFPIYKAMNNELDCDFFFGDSVFQPLKKFDANELSGFKGFIKARKLGYFTWYSKIMPIFNRKYTHYILTGELTMIVNWLIIVYAKLTGKKVYLWTHGLRGGNIHPVLRFLAQIFYKSATGILMYNNYNCQFMKKLGCKEKNLHVIHNSLDSQSQSNLYSSLKQTSIYKKHFGNNNDTLIYIGRIQRRKKTDLILDAMNLLKHQGISLNLVVVGENVDAIETFKEKIETYQMKDNVWLYGPCFDEEKNSELIYNAAACVSPGNVGLTCIHSLTYGTPVISNNNFYKQMPEFEAIIEGVTGDFFKENDATSLASTIHKWVNLSLHHREKIRKEARKEIEANWCVDSQIRVLKEVFNGKHSN